MRDAGKIALFALLCLVWGSTWLVIKVGYGGLGPFNVAGVRFAIAAALLAGLAPMVGARWPRGRVEALLVLWVAVLLFAGDYGLIYWAEQHIDSGLTAVLFATCPLFTMLFAHAYVPGEPLTPRKILGGVVAFIGVAVLFGDRLQVQAGELGPMAGVVGAAACAAGVNVATKRHGRDLPSTTLNASTMALGAVLLLAMSAARGDGVALPRDASTWAAILYLALVGSVVAFAIYFWLLKSWSSTTVSFFAVFTPAIALLLGAVVLGERLAAWSLAGSAAILAGVYLALVPARAP